MATTFTLSRKTYSAALDSTPLVIDEIDYLNYLEKSFADDKDRSGLALAAGGAVGLGGILGGSYMENSARDKVINDEIESIKAKQAEIGPAPTKDKKLLKAEQAMDPIRNKYRAHAQNKKATIEFNRPINEEIRNLEARREALANNMRGVYEKSNKRELEKVQKRIAKLQAESDNFDSWTSRAGRRIKRGLGLDSGKRSIENIQSDLANAYKDQDKFSRLSEDQLKAIENVGQDIENDINAASKRLKKDPSPVKLKPEDQKKVDDYLKRRNDYLNRVKEHTSKSAENAQRLKLLESRDQGTISSLLEEHADALKGNGKWLKRAGYGGLALGAGYWGAKKLGLLGGRKQPQQQQYYYQ